MEPGGVYKYYTGESTNAASFHQFLKELVTRIKPTVRVKPIIVFDQHSAHFKDYNMEFMQKHFYPFPQASYSSNFNCIETVWGIAKRTFGKLVISERRHVDSHKHRQFVETATGMVTQRQIRGVLRANRAYIRTCLLRQSNANFHWGHRYTQQQVQELQ